MKKKRRTTLIVLGVIVLLVIIVVLNLNARKSGDEVTTSIAKFSSIVSKVSATGNLKALYQVNLQSQVMGTVDRLYVHEGDRVKKGDLLCLLDRKSYEADLMQAKAQFEQAEAVLGRNESLYARKLIAQEQYESVKTAYEAAKSQYEQSQDRYNKTSIVAPISGTVAQVNIEEGETVIIGTMNNLGTVLMVIADMSQMLAIVDADETDMPSIRPGQTAEVSVDAIPDSTFAGVVTRVGYMPVENNLTSTSSLTSTGTGTDFEVEVKILKVDSAMKPGMTASADIVTAEKESVLVVPIQSIGRRTIKGVETQALFVVEKGVAKLTPVKTGSASETEIEITDGIKPGAQVISGPYKVLAKLKDGAKVNATLAEGERSNKTDKNANPSTGKK
jgi:HlyD family secretion protein